MRSPFPDFNVDFWQNIGANIERGWRGEERVKIKVCDGNNHGFID